MMVDIARCHRENLVNADLLPICCTYNLRAARKHIEGPSSYTDREDSADDISTLLAQEKVLHERWSCLRRHGSLDSMITKSAENYRQQVTLNAVSKRLSAEIIVCGLDIKCGHGNQDSGCFTNYIPIGASAELCPRGIDLIRL
jgi:hypothetical protein